MEMKQRILLYAFHSPVDIQKRDLLRRLYDGSPACSSLYLDQPRVFQLGQDLRMMTGFTLILDARKSLVILYSSLNVSIHVSIWIAMVNLLDICIKLYLLPIIICSCMPCYLSSF